MKFDSALVLIFSDLFVNLSAGWLGALIIVPNFSSEKGVKKLLVLTADILGIILSLFIAYKLKKLL